MAGIIEKEFSQETNLQQEEMGEEFEYASFYRRMFAAIIDLLILSFSVSWMFMLVLPPPPVAQKLKNDLLSQTITQEEYVRLNTEYFINQGGLQILIQNTIFQIVIIGIIIMAFWLYKASTPGKMLLSMKIADEKTFKKPSVSQIMIRYFCYFISSAFFFLGFIWIGFDKKKQGWHDKIARTVVILIKKKKEDAAT